MVRGDHVMLIHMYRPSRVPACIEISNIVLFFFGKSPILFFEQWNQYILRVSETKTKIICPTIKYHSCDVFINFFTKMNISGENNLA